MPDVYHHFRKKKKKKFNFILKHDFISAMRIMQVYSRNRCIGFRLKKKKPKLIATTLIERKKNCETDEKLIKMLRNLNAFIKSIGKGKAISRNWSNAEKKEIFVFFFYQSGIKFINPLKNCLTCEQQMRFFVTSIKKIHKRSVEHQRCFFITLKYEYSK